MRSAIIIVALSSLAAPAWATTGSCSSAPDGTPCVDECIDSGHCGGGSCIADHIAPDGTTCSTGNFCTLGDICQAGSCVAGSSQRVCPSAPDSCHVSACMPALGCTMTLICLDAGAPPDLMSSPDMTPVASDLGSTPDAAQTPPVVIIPADMAQPPVVGAADLAQPVVSAADMAQPLVGDMGAPDGGENLGPGAPIGSSPDLGAVKGKSPYVHGSAVGCSAAGGAPDPSLAAILLFTLLVPLRRRRAAAVSARRPLR